MMPEDEIAEYEKKFEKDRRARLREDKLREQEALQKERVQRALERAQAAPRNQVGRRPVPRSEPPRVKGSFQSKIQCDSGHLWPSVVQFLQTHSMK